MAANAAPHGHEAHQRRSGMGAAGSTLHGVGSATSVEDGVVAAAAVARKLLAPSPRAHQTDGEGTKSPAATVIATSRRTAGGLGRRRG